MQLEIKELICVSIHDVKNRIWFLEQQIRQQQETCSGLQSAAEELSRLATELSMILLAQRQVSGTFSPNYEEVWLDEWIPELQACLPDTAISLTWDIRTKQAFFDANMVGIATRELIFNAIKHAETRAHIEVFSANAVLHITIHDDGPGMGQHEGGDRLLQNATGLGLALARQLIEAHIHNEKKGVLTMLHQGLLGGATLEILLP